MGEKNSIANVPLKFVKSTKGTHVFANEDTGFSIYIPRACFMQQTAPPAQLTLRLNITVESE